MKRMRKAGRNYYSALRRFKSDLNHDIDDIDDGGCASLV